MTILYNVTQHSNDYIFDLTKAIVSQYFRLNSPLYVEETSQIHFLEQKQKEKTYLFTNGGHFKAPVESELQIYEHIPQTLTTAMTFLAL